MPTAPVTHRPAEVVAKRSVLSRLLRAEIVLDEKYRPYATAFVALFAIGYAVMFLGLMHFVAYIGPGLGDDLSFGPYRQLLTGLIGAAQAHHSYWLLTLFLALSLANVLFTAASIFLGYWLYPKVFKRPFPLDVLATYLGLNAIGSLGILLVYAGFGVLASLSGHDFAEGYAAFGHALEAVRAWTQRIPTVMALPGWLAFFLIVMTGGFFHYWLHRLSHESRALWLLFHRTHHMTPELIQPATQAVFFAVPLFVFAAFPYVFIFGAISKLISDEPIYAGLIVYKLISAFANMFSHQTALYAWAQQRWWIRGLSIVTSEGVNHYLHHSAEAGHNRPRGNLINIGGGMFFFWDRVFGTYRPTTSHRPVVGLMGAPRLYLNPIRLALAGVAQLGHELIHNGGLKTRLMVLCGPSDYLPPRTRDYAVKEAQGEPAALVRLDKEAGAGDLTAAGGEAE